VNLSLYVERRSWLHRLHPAVRLLGALVLFTAAFWADHPRWQIWVAALVAALAWSAGALSSFFKLRHLFAIVFVVTLAVWAVFHPRDTSPVYFALGSLTLTRAGCLFAVAMALKLSVFLAAGTLLLAVSRIEEIAYALSCFGLPRKVGFTITLSFRMVPLFLDNAQRVVDAQRCRGLDFDSGSLLRRVRCYVPVIVPVFMGALRRADALAMALDGRGFQRRGRRSVFRAQRLGAPDAAALAALAVLMALLVYLRWLDLLRLS